ncbi:MULTISPECIES: type II secretion system protein M [unclassified Vibrio]|uniref:Type II secretion system protein M n=1 Tax=Vibrio sp. HB236076 TaxID=3232307 RepID=A0AB39HG44_9VIBR|nr:type II secretion system protein M [Vibrio sp. HB161653]MDP5255223.1 type II secretion system protein M [Vibrio sp. HB161653]
MKSISQPLLQWWQTITSREQKLVIGAGLVVAIALLYWGIVMPLLHQAEQAEQRLNSAMQLNTWVSERANQIVQLRGQGGRQYSSAPLNQLVAESAGQFTVELIRMQPRNDDGLQVWIQPLAFDQLINWIDFLQQQQGITVEYLDIDRGQQSGTVEVNRLQFKRG